MKQTPSTIDAELATVCKALAHPARVAIFRQLLEADRCFCGEIVKVMDLAQSTVSQHLKILKQAGLVQGTIEGPKTCYCVDKDRLKQFLEMCGCLKAVRGCCQPKDNSDD